MNIKDLYSSNSSSSVYIITDDTNYNELEWTIEPTLHELIPNEEALYCVKAKYVQSGSVIDCYLLISIPERIAEIAILKTGNTIIAQRIYEIDGDVIPAVASECYGSYELFLSTQNPEVGIATLINGLKISNSKSAIAEDLGYILRDINRNEEAIEAFLISEKFTPSSEFTYLELSQLYSITGQEAKAKEYQIKFNTI